MSDATFIAFGAVAIGLLVFSFCIYVAVSANKKKQAQQKDPAAWRGLCGADANVSGKQPDFLAGQFGDLLADWWFVCGRYLAATHHVGWQSIASAKKFEESKRAIFPGLITTIFSMCCSFSCNSISC